MKLRLLVVAVGYWHALDDLYQVMFKVLQLCLIDCWFFAHQTSSKKKKEQERSSNLIKKLQEEKQRQEDNHRLVTSWIKKEKDSWFSSSESIIHICVFLESRGVLVCGW